jgi:hypothetical protein
MKKTLFAIILLALCISFSACNIENQVLCREISQGNTLYQLWSKGNKITKITVCVSDTHQQTFPVAGIECEDTSEDCGFEIIDLNFDGIDDFRILTLNSDGLTKYSCFIFDSEQKQYFQDPVLNSVKSPIIDRENQKITSFSTYTKEFAPIGDIGETYEIEYVKSEYIWRESKLYICAKKSLTYYSENDIYCFCVYKFDENGREIDSEEKWIFSPENLNVDDYMN